MSIERSLKGRTLFITGASRGIGLAIAVKAAADGANIALVAKTVDPNPKLPGTLHSAAEAVRAAGPAVAYTRHRPPRLDAGRALPAPSPAAPWLPARNLARLDMALAAPGSLSPQPR